MEGMVEDRRYHRFRDNTLKIEHSRLELGAERFDEPYDT
jgi:hypothetical protein